MQSANLSRYRRPLAAGIAAIFSLVTPMAMAATNWIVNSCDPGTSGDLPTHTGTLRFAATNAVSGDTIDLTNTSCSTITLSTGGAILLTQADITLKGPGKTALSIDGNHSSRVLNHMGTGTLSIYDLTIANGYFAASANMPAYGGCIFSDGSVSLSGTAVRSCEAIAGGAAARAKGGGIYAAKNVSMNKYSEIADNALATVDTFDLTNGGGVYAQQDLIVGSSTISGNQASFGGGAAVGGSTFIIASTISGNTAKLGGGIYARRAANSEANTFTLSNSTVSGNFGTVVVGGVMTNAGTVEVKNSTVAFNKANLSKNNSWFYSAGFDIDDSGAYYTDSTHYQFKKVTLQSSVFSNNTSGALTPVADDFGITRFSNVNLVPVSGAGNLVFLPGVMTTLTNNIATQGVCPRLGPLRDNGGKTRTHALFSGSPAIDHGNNTVPQTVDQRGAPFVRVSGAAADIGAYEVQQDDVVFNSGFDGCP